MNTMVEVRPLDHVPGQDTICTECGTKKKWVAQKFPKLSYWEPCSAHLTVKELLCGTKLLLKLLETPNERLNIKCQARILKTIIARMEASK